ncbi:MAG TPA: hypothetical protein VLJ39_01045 [Tepidisphaeraceae bacterium]|jgi:uncharacterized protein YpmS|nr:hypothetical protein [Tepidisphaeraceae bacterium]
MKWLKRLVYLAVFLVVLAGALGAAGWWLSRRPPEWYSRRKATAQETQAAADRVQRQVQRTLSWAADQQAYADSSRHGSPTTHPDQTLEISFTEDELNGFFQSWDSHFGWSNRYGDFVADPQIVLRDGQILLAAMVKQMGTVMSVEFDPKLVDGKLQMPVEQVRAGQLPLPESVWDHYRTQLVSQIGARLPDWQKGAQIRPNGTANADAVAAAMSELMQDLLTNRPAKPILFLPYDISNSQRSLPVKLTDIRISHGTLHLRVEPLTSSERQTLLRSIRTEPVRTALNHNRAGDDAQ